MPTLPPSPAVGRVFIVHGARAAESLLVARLDELQAQTARDPALLATPIRVIVPSGSLRDHLLARLVAPRQGRRGAVAGILVQTLFSLAAEILERAGESPPSGEHLFEVVVQREARREPALREALGGLVEGFASVAGSVRDLLDAGLEPVHAEAAEEALRSDGPGLAGRGAVERAVALVRTAARTEEMLGLLGRGRRSNLLRRAAELLTEARPAGDERDERDPLPARALFIHGFADATGVATDLLETLVRRRGAWAILDHPPRAADQGFETAFAERFGARLLQALPAAPPEPLEELDESDGEQEVIPGVLPAEASLHAFEALGAEAEVREVARRLRSLLDAGTPPEAIGLVARDLAAYRFAIARYLGRLGIPFFAPGTSGALDRAGRRRAALLELLDKGERTATDRWLDAHSPAPLQTSGADAEPSLDVDLRLALLSLGAARLREVAELPLERILRGETLLLPIRQGLGSTASQDAAEGDPADGSNASEESDGHLHPARRGVPSPAVRRLVASAARVRRHLEAWPSMAPFAVHARALRTLVAEGLGWTPGDEVHLQLEEALRLAGAEVPEGLELEREEVRLLLARLLLDGSNPPLGGKGGGVQLLSVTEARGRTFDHLFALGLQRNSFPRVVRQDPLLADDLRAVLQRVLPDVPLKLAGFDEERYLFAQLLSAAPRVVLSWQVADDDGKPQPPSPLVDRLRGRIEVERAPALWSPAAARGLRTANERATFAGLYGEAGAGSEGAVEKGERAHQDDREAFSRLLPWALAESRGGSSAGAPSAALRELAAGRSAVLAELDPDLRTAEGRAARARLGPYFGFLGALDSTAGRSDPRRRPLYVTHLENLAGCPWQLFLERLLGIEPAPDPTGLLPGIDASLLGRAVHTVLERIGKLALQERPPGSPDEEPVLAAWPAPSEVEALARAAAERLLAEDGVYLAGLAGALARQTLPYLEVAHRLDWGAGPLPLLGVERDGTIAALSASGRTHQVGFRADRVDSSAQSELGDPSQRADGGARRWTDYKTGRPLSEAKGEAKRAEHFLAKVRAGTHLQAVAYLRAAPEAPTDAVGRYLFLRPDLASDALREVAVRRDDAPFQEAFTHAAATLLESWETGSLFPRLVEIGGRKEPPRCGRCQVAEACLRGDSGARRRLYDWTIGAGARTAGGAEAALLRTWRLAAPAEAGESTEGADAEPAAAVLRAVPEPGA